MISVSRLVASLPPVLICNGVIIQCRLILTTASCIHYQLTVESAAEPFQPNKLLIIAGTSSEFASELTVQVLDIIIANSFNVTTHENDLAILRLNSNLPLGIRNDLKWVILDDIDNADKPCLANFYFRNIITVFLSSLSFFVKEVILDILRFIANAYLISLNQLPKVFH
uniref:Peptidase S1 domain-containing protein n=1 Tax=Glossina pallidipes TaxID=7398 RepID=A0A1B0AH95_GLOPL